MDRNDQAAKDKVIEIIKDIHIAMLATRGPDGKFHSRPMAASDATFDGTLFFLTEIESGKVHDLESDRESLITFSDPGKRTYVSLRGTGAIIRDKSEIKKHLTAEARAWFPKGVEDPGIALIEVDIEEAEYWDAPSGKMVVLYAYAKAMVTGQKAGNVGEHERVSMR